MAALVRGEALGACPIGPKRRKTAPSTAKERMSPATKLSCPVNSTSMSAEPSPLTSTSINVRLFGISTLYRTSFGEEENEDVPTNVSVPPKPDRSIVSPWD